MSASLDLLRVLCPDLSGEADDRVETFLTVAAQRLNPPCFGGLFQQATIYLAAHLLLRSPTGGTGGVAVGGLGGGPVTSRKTGDEAISFGSPAAATGTVALSDADLVETHYGKQFLAIRDTRACAAPAFRVIPGAGTLPTFLG
jgi:hypothetical protein